MIAPRFCIAWMQGIQRWNGRHIMSHFQLPDFYNTAERDQSMLQFMTSRYKLYVGSRGFGTCHWNWNATRCFLSWIPHNVEFALPHVEHERARPNIALTAQSPLTDHGVRWEHPHKDRLYTDHGSESNDGLYGLKVVSSMLYIHSLWGLRSGGLITSTRRADYSTRINFILLPRFCFACLIRERMTYQVSMLQPPILQRLATLFTHFGDECHLIRFPPVVYSV